MAKGLRRALAGDLSLFGGPPSDEATAARLRAHYIANVIGNTQSLMLANACNALVLVLAFWNSPNRSVAIVWASILIAAVGANYVRRIRRPKPPPQSVSEAAVREVVWRAVVLGGLWSAAPLLFFEDASAGQQLIIACLCAGMLCGGAMALKSIPIAAISFMIPIFVGSGVALARTGDHTYWLAGALMLLFSMVLVRVVLANAHQAVGSLLQQFDVEQRVRTDPLTGLPNRIWFQESLEVAFSRLRRNHERFALFCFDLDNFKVVNDRMGHSAGDELLIEVAERLKKCTRLGDTLARIGGDEFVLVAANVDTRQQASIIANRIVSAFRTPFVVDSLEVMSAVSIGIGLAPIDGVDARELIRSADIALYRAKNARSGSFEFFEARHDAAAREQRALEHDLANAINRKELRLAYQPIVDLKTRCVIGVEALLRWQHPERGLLLPSDFLSIAEATGLIRSVGEWVLMEACRVAQAWPTSIRLALNFSAVQFREPAIAAQIFKALDAASMASRRLEIEVTETILISDDEGALQLLSSLSRAGIGLALDNFGAGYSSLGYLRKLPFSRIKIDRSFVRDVGAPDSSAILTTIIHLARELEIKTTAEGIETEGQLAFLSAAGCDEGQGFLVGQPMTPEEITGRLSQERVQAA